MPQKRPLSVKKVKGTQPKKMNEFELFVKMIRLGLGGHLGKIAEQLGVAPETLSDWNKRPEVIEAHQEAVEEAIRGMKEAGKTDWRMWDKAIDRAGLVVQQKTDITTNQKDISGNLTNEQLEQIVARGTFEESKSTD